MATSYGAVELPVSEPAPGSRRRMRLAAAAAAAAAALVFVSAAVVSRGGAFAETSLDALPAIPKNSAATFDKSTCDTVDDDAQYDETCGANDQGAWCVEEGSRAAIEALCPGSCDGPLSWAMPCAWMAVKSLPDFCAGSYVPRIGAPAQNLPAHPSTSVKDGPGDGFDAYRPNHDALDLFACDAHAICYSCNNPLNAGTTADDRYCAAVMSYYGGAGTQFTLGDDEDRQISKGVAVSVQGGSLQLYEGANAAVRALLSDRDFWCSPDTLGAIEAGTFDEKAKTGRDDKYFYLKLTAAAVQKLF